MVVLLQVSGGRQVAAVSFMAAEGTAAALPLRCSAAPPLCRSAAPTPLQRRSSASPPAVHDGRRTGVSCCFAAGCSSGVPVMVKRTNTHDRYGAPRSRRPAARRQFLPPVRAAPPASLLALALALASLRVTPADNISSSVSIRLRPRIFRVSPALSSKVRLVLCVFCLPSVPASLSAQCL